MGSRRGGVEVCVGCRDGLPGADEDEGATTKAIGEETHLLLCFSLCVSLSLGFVI